MVNQTEFINHLRERMNKSFEEGYYLESIACSYAIIENRTKKLVEHLDKSSKNMLVSKKTQYLYTQILGKNQEMDSNRKKLISFLEYRLKGNKLMEVVPNIDKIKYITDVGNGNQNLILFCRQRNHMTHELAKYDSQNPSLIDFGDYIELAYLGKEVAEKLSATASAMKRKKQQLKK